MTEAVGGEHIPCFDGRPRVEMDVKLVQSVKRSGVPGLGLGGGGGRVQTSPKYYEDWAGQKGL